MAKGKHRMAHADVIRAPDIRVARGEVVLESRVELGPTGKVIGRRVGDVVQDWLSRHRKRGEITERQHRAGQRLQEDAERSQIGIPSLLAPTRIAAGSNVADIAMYGRGALAIGAAIRFRKAVIALGPCGAVVLAVAVRGLSAAVWARSRGLPDGDGIATLRLGLEALADHYGLDH